MSDRKVTVNENDLRVVLFTAGSTWSVTPSVDRLRATLDALGPEPCGHPSWRLLGPGGSSPLFRCVLPKGHHVGPFFAADPCCSCGAPKNDPIHCGDAHQPPADVWRLSMTDRKVTVNGGTTSEGGSVNDRKVTVNEADYRHALDRLAEAYPLDVFPWPSSTPDGIAAEMARRTIANIRSMAREIATSRLEALDD